MGANRRRLLLHRPYRLTPERHRPLSRLVRLDVELLVLVHHIDEPLVCLIACGEAVGGREPERHLGGRHVRVGILAADGRRGGKETLQSLVESLDPLANVALDISSVLGPSSRGDLADLLGEGLHVLRSRLAINGPGRFRPTCGASQAEFEAYLSQTLSHIL